MAHTRDRCALYVDDYPYLNLSHAVSRVVGEVFELTPALLARLDDFEDVPTLYQRVRIPVALEGEGPLDAWTYARESRSGRLLRHGEFTAGDVNPSSPSSS